MRHIEGEIAISRVHDPSDLENVSLEEIRRGRTDVFWRQAGPPARTFMRRRPRYHDDPDKVRMFGDLSTRSVEYGAVGVMSLEDAVAVGFRTTISRNLQLHTDQTFSDPVEAERIFAKLSDKDPFRGEGVHLEKRSSNHYIDLRNRPVSKFTEPTILLSSDEPGNYGSFLFRVLPKISLVRLLPTSWRIVGPRSRVYDELYVHMGIDPNRVIHHETDKLYHFANAVVPTLRNPHALLDEESLALFSAVREKAFAARALTPEWNSGRSRMLFVSRRGLASTKAGYRRLENEDELADQLERLGFEVVEPQLMSAREQIDVFGDASIVVGQSGAGMFNVAFCRPGTVVIDIESEPYWIHAHMCFFSSLNLVYGVFEGKSTVCGEGAHRPFLVNVGGVVRRVQECIREG